MEQRAGLYFSMNGTHSDLSVMMMVARFGKSASFRVMFIARVISFRKCLSVVTTFVKVCHEFVTS